MPASKHIGREDELKLHGCSSRIIIGYRIKYLRRDETNGSENGGISHDESAFVSSRTLEPNIKRLSNQLINVELL
jgi:hypothetical protein